MERSNLLPQSFIEIMHGTYLCLGLGVGLINGLRFYNGTTCPLFLLWLFQALWVPFVIVKQAFNGLAYRPICPTFNVRIEHTI